MPVSRLLTVVRRGSCGPTRKLIFLRIQLLVLFSNEPKYAIRGSSKCLRKLLPHFGLGARDQQLGAEQVSSLVGPQEPLLATVKRRKPAWFGHVHTPLQPLQNHPSGHFGGWVMPRSAEKCWMDNIKEWTSLPMPELLTSAPAEKI